MEAALMRATLTEVTKTMGSMGAASGHMAKVLAKLADLMTVTGSLTLEEPDPWPAEIDADG
jgi:hypothetical protein